MLHPDVQTPTANVITNTADGLDFQTPNVLLSKGKPYDGRCKCHSSEEMTDSQLRQSDETKSHHESRRLRPDLTGATDRIQTPISLIRRSFNAGFEFQTFICSQKNFSFYNLEDTIRERSAAKPLE